MAFLPHASDRVAHAIVAVRFSEKDPRTVEHWASANAMTAARLRGRCALAGVPCRSALAFARMLRAGMLVERHQCAFEEALDIAEPATLRRFLRWGGVQTPCDVAKFSLTHFFAGQSMVTQRLVVERVRALLNGDATATTVGSFSAESSDGNSDSCGLSPNGSRR